MPNSIKVGHAYVRFQTNFKGENSFYTERTTDRLFTSYLLRLPISSHITFSVLFYLFFQSALPQYAVSLAACLYISSLLHIQAHEHTQTHYILLTLQPPHFFHSLQPMEERVEVWQKQRLSLLRRPCWAGCRQHHPQCNAGPLIYNLHSGFGKNLYFSLPSLFPS